MKHLKTFENFTTNETLDMFTMPVDPIEGFDDMWDDFYKDMKAKIKDILSKLKQEGKETKEAFNLCIKASKEDVDLTKGERTKIFQQLKDLFKVVGLGLLSIIPGDIFIFMLIKFLKLESYILPSSFA